MVATGVRRRGRPAAEPLDALPHVVAVAAHDGQVEHRDGDLRRVAADLLAVPSEHLGLRLDAVDGHVAAVGESRRDAKGTALAAAADDQRDVVRPVAGSRSSRAATPAAPSYALVPGAHSARIVSMAVSSRSSRSRAGGNGRPNAEVLALPPAGADPAERPAAGDRVEGGGRLGGDARAAGTSPA